MSDPVTTIQTATDVVDSASNLFVAITDMVPKLIAASTVLAAFIPKPDSPVMLKLHRFVNLLAFNFGHASNKGGD